MTDVEAMELVERIHAASGPVPEYMLLHPRNFYALLVVANDPRWLGMEFMVVRGESRGRTEERWRQLQAWTWRGRQA